MTQPELSTGPEDCPELLQGKTSHIRGSGQECGLQETMGRGC